MSKSILELVTGDWKEKQEYRQLMKRVNCLPEDYRTAFKKIQHYFYHVGAMTCDLSNYSNIQSMFMNLLELFEASAAQGKQVLEITGSDTAAFCDELMRASSADHGTLRAKLNQDIHNYFHREVN